MKSFLSVDFGLPPFYLFFLSFIKGFIAVKIIPNRVATKKPVAIGLSKNPVTFPLKIVNDCLSEFSIKLPKTNERTNVEVGNSNFFMK